MRHDRGGKRAALIAGPPSRRWPGRRSRRLRRRPERRQCGRILSQWKCSGASRRAPHSFALAIPCSPCRLPSSAPCWRRARTRARAPRWRGRGAAGVDPRLHGDGAQRGDEFQPPRRCRSATTRNPRTSMRELPSGRMSRAEAIAFVVVSTLLFIGAAWMVSPLCGRWRRSRSASSSGIRWPSGSRHYAQIFLGLSMAVAPVGGWIAMGGPLNAAVPARTRHRHMGRGLRHLYACQDLVDRREACARFP